MVLQSFPNLPGSWVQGSRCSVPSPQACMITRPLTGYLGRWEKGGWDRGGGGVGGGREPEDRGTTDIRSIQKRKEGELGGRRRV